jgi:hypothetical protein
MTYTGEQKRSYDREWLRERRARYMAGRVCLKCGSNERLEIHHRNPAEKISHKIWSWAEPRLLAELAKCDILCHDCHLKITIEQQRTTEHGTGGMYKHGCRCQDCKEWNNNRSAKQRTNKEANTMASGRRNWSTHYTVNYTNANGVNVPNQIYYDGNSMYWETEAITAKFMLRLALKNEAAYLEWEQSLADGLTHKQVHDAAFKKYHELTDQPRNAMGSSAPEAMEA